MSKLKKSLFVLLAVTTISSCSIFNKVKKEGVNVFTIQQDRDFGAQVAAEIDGNRAEYPLLDSASNKEVYAYVYTGILKFMESEDQFAGVLGHEIAHADMRHSTRQMTKLYGVDVLLNIIAGKYEMVKQVTESIVGMKFSRDHETEADQRSVEYLCPTPYNAAGGAGFFQKMENLSKSGQQFEFLSTHPSPANRIQHFHNAKTDLGCLGNETYKNEYQEMLRRLNVRQNPTPTPKPPVFTPPVFEK